VRVLGLTVIAYLDKIIISITEILVIGREMSARTIRFHQAIANVAGVSVTDLKCLDYI